jgi:hypothetical protein
MAGGGGLYGVGGGGKSEGKRPFGRPGVGVRIILRWILRKWNVGIWT